jgi:hypothetical protein
MKKIFAILVVFCFASASFAQLEWGTDGVKIFNKNTGNVLVGDGATFSQTSANIGFGKMHMKTATNASLFLESSKAGAINGAYGQFRLVSGTTGHIFNNVLRYGNSTGIATYEMLQSLYDPSGAGKWCEFLYFRYSDHKFEFRDGITDAAFYNYGKVYFNNGPSGPGAADAGQVGIGTTNIPAGIKLAVGGKVACKEVEVTLSYFPDYVFASDYKLRSLYDVENFIKANNHLPDVPSASEVTSNGLNLGDMNATLLQKVEELTLYMIQLQKENDALKVRVGNLEK